MTDPSAINAEYPELDPKWLLQAVVLVLEKWEKDGREPRAEKWREFSVYREKIWDAVKYEWSAASGWESAVFPWQEDTVIRTWTRYAKKNNEQKQVFKTLIGVSGGLVGTTRLPNDQPPRKKK